MAVVLIGRVVNQKIKKSGLSAQAGLYIIVIAIIIIIKVIEFTCARHYLGRAFSL